MLLYVAVSLLNHFFCDKAIIDKTLFNDICNLGAFAISWSYVVSFIML